MTDVLEKTASGTSVVHRLHPLIKLGLVIAYILTVLSISPFDLPKTILAACFPMAALMLADIPPRVLLRRVWIGLPFVFFTGVSNLWFDRRVMFTLSGLTITFGLISFLTLMLKAVLTIAAVFLLMATTPRGQLVSLLAALHIPPQIITQIGLSFRYLQTLGDEASQMWTAYHLRAPKSKGIHLLDSGSFLGQLFLRSLDRSERVWMAMQCRGYRNANAAQPLNSFRARDWLVGGGVLALLFWLQLTDLTKLFS